MTDSRKIIIIGGNHHNTLGVIRSLGRKGVQPDVIITRNDPSSFVLKSKYIAQKHIVDGSEAAIDLLLSEYANDKEKSIVIACHDGISSLLDLNKNQLSKFFILPGIAIQGRVTELMNKKTMGEVANGSGLNVPKTWVISDSKMSQIKDIVYPCITKPLESCNGSKGEIKICYDSVQLKRFLESEKGKSFLVQQFIKKDLEFQLIGCSLNNGNDVIIPGVSVILRQPANTNTGFLHYQEPDSSYVQTIEKTRNYIKTMGYSGLFSVEFLRDKQGVDYFMEINFRNDGNAIAVTRSGVNLPYIWYLAGCNCDYEKEIGPIHDEFVMPEFAEMSLYVVGLISRAEWKEDMKKATSYMDFDPDDPNPTDGWNNYNHQKRLAFIKRLAYKILKKH